MNATIPTSAPLPMSESAHRQRATGVRAAPLLVAALLAAGCAGASEVPPSGTDRYVRALNHKLAGDAESYERELIALAHDEPETRAGRRAHATLTSGGLLTTVAVVGALAAIAIPNFTKFQNRARAGEAKEGLHDLARALQAFYAEHNRYCETFAECGWQPPAEGVYLYYLSLDEVTGAAGVSDAPLLRLRVESTLAAMNVQPAVNQGAYFLVAAGDPDNDGELDIWSLDESGNLVNLLNDDGA